jgi:hypothetical protein
LVALPSKVLACVSAAETAQGFFNERRAVDLGVVPVGWRSEREAQEHAVHQHASIGISPISSSSTCVTVISPEPSHSGQVSR